MRKLRLGLSAEERELFSCKLTKNVLSWEKYKRARRILIYFPYAGEIDVKRLCEFAETPQKRFFLPQIRGEGIMTLGEYTQDCQMTAGEYGIMEPVCEVADGSMFDIDLVIAPAIACDKNGGRLGQGGGYYDRFLKELRRKNPAAVFSAAVYDFQVVDKLICEQHDVKMDYVISPSGIFCEPLAEKL